LRVLYLAAVLFLSANSVFAQFSWNSCSSGPSSLTINSFNIVPDHIAYPTPLNLTTRTAMPWTWLEL
jgi:hypothetical protein